MPTRPVRLARRSRPAGLTLGPLNIYKMLMNLTVRRWIVSVFLGLLAMPPIASSAMPPEEAKIIQGYKAKAEKGDPEAQVILGVCYSIGNGVEKDFVQAVFWYRKAAQQGDAGGQILLGDSYYNGIGIEKDFVQAVYWYQKAAVQEDAEAQRKLGLCHDGGLGVTKNEVEGVKWYRKAAEQGDAHAQQYLGMAYELGAGVAKDDIEAYAYLNLSGITNEDARKRRGLLEKKLSPDAVLRGQQRTKELQKEIEAKIASKKAAK